MIENSEIIPKRGYSCWMGMNTQINTLFLVISETVSVFIIVEVVMCFIGKNLLNFFLFIFNNIFNFRREIYTCPLLRMAVPYTL